MPVIYPPDSIYIPANHTSIFLAGSIEMGKAEDWQQKVITAIDSMNVTILNPRRAAWNADWEQTIFNPDFKGQVSWELEGLERASLILVYFEPTTKAPVSMLEFGLYARSGKLLVCCPDGFWRKGNIDIVCERYSITQVSDLESLIQSAKVYLNTLIL
ncbi:nucleoside 2-deoxyribosyltransferase domain-containing protein [Cytophagaceae bacterium YF14B1]|uniref:Nucleoside 2-deoxyribosyltransferase domain-containing protein n=1 Tax=Xanthocytophaga flava TaxID=3048013 RepID=A0AAE3QTI4_9BACT|nr:nucleoside 2-deoxyribosyltransferase domain-containing protein [Xanthocytophaga flavus]MDJ1483185.1 nucleoside 2-deoxyribosyltransferase domain-containing protein [Xanthocytophaga flavus]